MHTAILAVFDDDRFDTSSIVVTSYKLEWAMEYVSEAYSRIDPIYNNVTTSTDPLDWRNDLDKSDAAQFFSRFYIVNGGRNGISIPVRLQPSVAAAVSMVFDTADEDWEQFKRRKMPEMVHAAHVMVSRTLHIHGWIENESVKLTPRERECLHHAALGLSDADIAGGLGIARWTVVAHLQSAKLKLGAFNKTAAVAKAVALGIVKPTR